MLGIIMRELKKFVESRHDRPTWHSLLGASGMEGKVFLPLSEYDDAELVAIVAHAAELTGAQVPELLEEFGAFIVPDLFQIYKTMIDPAWKTLELIEHTEKMIHQAIRLRDPKAKPPELAVARLGPHAVQITYRSHRKLCAIAKGITRGLAAQFGERIEIDERACMHRGDAACIIDVTKRPIVS